MVAGPRAAPGRTDPGRAVPGRASGLGRAVRWSGSIGRERRSFASGSGYQLNIRSRGRALLMLFLFSDVGPDDAPTRVRTGSHHDAARLLAPYGENGAEFFAFARAVPATAHRPEVAATGAAGDVYLCHPFLVHSAQPHRGATPRFMAQPPLLPRGELDLEHPASPVERAVHHALA